MNIHTLDLQFLGIPASIAAFVVEGPEGLALVESGPASTLPHLQRIMSENGWKMADFQHIFLTHIHFDHAGAAWAFAEKGARIYVHPKGLPHLAQPEKLYQSAQMIYGDGMNRLWGEMRPIPEHLLFAPKHSECLEVLGLQVFAWYTPGHAVHHIAWEFRDKTTQESVLFTGDVAGVRMANGPVMPPCPPPDIQVEDWQASIQLMRELSVSRLFLTHFGEIPDKNSHLDELEKRLLDWANWMKPFALNNTSPASIVPDFQEYVQQQLLDAGVSSVDLPRYEAANPAFMSVAGLLRYWKKRIA